MPKTIRGLQAVAVVLALCAMVVGGYALQRGLVLTAMVDAMLIANQISIFIFLERLRRRVTYIIILEDRP